MTREVRTGGHSTQKGDNQRLISYSYDLWGEVAPGRLFRVLDGDGFDSAQHYVFGHLHTEPLHPRDQHIGTGHPSHGFMSKHVTTKKTAHIIFFNVKENRNTII